MVVCLERGADLHMAQLMPLPLTVSCSSKIQTGLTLLVPAHPGSPGQRAVKRVCVSVGAHVDIQLTSFRASSLLDTIMLLGEQSVQVTNLPRVAVWQQTGWRFELQLQIVKHPTYDATSPNVIEM